MGRPENLSLHDLLERIRRAEELLLEGEEFIDRQRELVMRGMLGSDDLALRRKLLATFEALQEFRIADLERMRDQLVRFSRRH